MTIKNYMNKFDFEFKLVKTKGLRNWWRITIIINEKLSII